MHIVMITDDFPPNIGGIAAHVWELSKALVKLGHQVTVLTAVELKTQERLNKTFYRKYSNVKRVFQKNGSFHLYLNKLI